VYSSCIPDITDTELLLAFLFPHENSTCKDTVLAAAFESVLIILAPLRVRGPDDSLKDKDSNAPPRSDACSGNMDRSSGAGYLKYLNVIETRLSESVMLTSASQGHAATHLGSGTTNLSVRCLSNLDTCESGTAAVWFPKTTSALSPVLAKVGE
jgi:hypothetical protein